MLIGNVEYSDAQSTAALNVMSNMIEKNTTVLRCPYCWKPKEKNSELCGECEDIRQKHFNNASNMGIIEILKNGIKRLIRSEHK